MDRRDILGGGLTLIASAITGSAKGQARITSVQPHDTRFMEMAIAEATKAAFPFGAVIVKNNEVIARGYNRTGVDHDPTAHGEMVAIRACLAAHGPDALKEATLYTSGEPCCMCMGAIIWCEIGRLVYAASVTQLSTKIGQIMLSAEDVAAKTPFMQIDIAGGVLDQKAMALFK